MKKKRITIDSIESRYAKGRHTLAGKINTTNKSHSVWFRYHGPSCPVPGDVFLFAALSTAMRDGCDVVLGPEQPAGPFPEIEEFQERLRNLEHGLSRINVRSEPGRRATGAPLQETLPRGRAGAGFFFVPEVDAFYTLHRHFNAIEQLVFVHWFDPGARFWLPRVKTSRLIRRYARNLGKPLVEIETNLNCFFIDEGGGVERESDRVCSQAAMGALLAGQFNRIYLDSRNGNGAMPSRAKYGPGPGGAWLNTPLIQFRRHQTAATLQEKVAAMVENEVLVSALRLCWENPDRNFNCGRCPECTRNRSAQALFTGLGRGAPGLGRPETGNH